MMRPRVLVLLAARNGEKWIVEQVESILSQVGVDVRIVISDDHSSDRTRQKIAELTCDSRISVVTPSIATGSAAQNFMWLICNVADHEFEYLALADQDDIWHAEKLLRGVLHLERHGAAGYSCAVTAFWADGRNSETLTQSPNTTKLDFMFEGAGQGCTFVLKSDFFRRMQDFCRSHASQIKELHYHDWAIYALSRSWRLTWSFDKQAMVRYRQHDQNDTGARSSRDGVNKRVRLIKSGWYRRQMISIAAMCAIAAPNDRRIARWNLLVAQAPGVGRQIRMAGICIVSGRRRALDRLILTLAVLTGYV